MKLTLYVADRRMNEMMCRVDLCPDYKVFTTVIEQEFDRKGFGSDEAFIWRVIEESKSEKAYWIPAIQYNGLLYATEGIKEISDGNKIIFVRQAVTE